jgi:hypothetical protein
MSDAIRMFVYNFGLCLVGCVLAALLGRLTRKTGDLRFFLGMLVVPMLSWFFLITGGGHGVAVILPTVYLFFLMMLSPDVGGSWNLFSENGALNEDLLFFLSLILFFILIIVSFFVFARSPKPKPRR